MAAGVNHTRTSAQNNHEMDDLSIYVLVSGLFSGTFTVSGVFRRTVNK